MAKKVVGVVKLQLPAGKATPAPPVGPALGQYGVNIMEFVKQFNAKTANQPGMVIPAVLTVYADRSFTFVLKTPPASVLIRKAAGIENVGRIEVYFHAYDSDTYDSIFSGEYAEIETSAVDRMDTKANDDGMELYNEDDIRIVGKTVDEDSFWGAAILLYIENNSGRNVGISVDDMSVNGFMMTPYFSTEVYDGKMTLDDITLMSSELKENGIETVEDVELKFHIYDLSSYETIADSDTITFTAQ